MKTTEETSKEAFFQLDLFILHEVFLPISLDGFTFSKCCIQKTLW